jgi:methionine sulfoxide reductase heme-binding subunit
MTSAPSNYVWWLAGRSAGLVALALITASVILGLVMAARLLPARMRKQAMRTHQQLALVGLGAIAAHGGLLAADPWLKAGAKGVLVPFAIGYRRAWVAMGVIGGYLAALLGLSFYARRRIGARTWRSLHRLTVVAYVLSLAHAIGAGTDAALPAVREAMLASALPILVLFVLRAQRSSRHVTPKGERPPRSLPAGAREPHEADAPAARLRPHRGAKPVPAGRLDVSPSQAR